MHDKIWSWELTTNHAHTYVNDTQLVKSTARKILSKFTHISIHISRVKKPRQWELGL